MKVLAKNIYSRQKNTEYSARKTPKEKYMHRAKLQETSHVSLFYQHVLQTPLLSYNGFSTPWKELSLKDETKQFTRAFKFRGNFHRLLRLPSTDQAVTTASTGNHRLGLSMAACLCGIQAYIFVPTTTAQVKLQAIAEAGATISKVDGDYEQCKQASQSLSPTPRSTDRVSTGASPGS